MLARWRECRYRRRSQHLLLSIGISVYAVATAEAEAKGEALKHEGAVTGAGIAGDMAGVHSLDLRAGPARPCVWASSAFRGGALAAFGVDYFW